MILKTKNYVVEVNDMDVYRDDWYDTVFVASLGLNETSDYYFNNTNCNNLEELKQKYNEEEYTIYPVYATIHSGIWFNLGGAIDKWDSGFYGYVILNSYWVERNGILTVLEDLSNFMNGYCYGLHFYEIESIRKKEIDYCDYITTFGDIRKEVEDFLGEKVEMEFDENFIGDFIENHPDLLGIKLKPQLTLAERIESISID